MNNTQKPRNTTGKDFESFFNDVPIKIWMSDIEGNCVNFNKKWLQFRGRTLEQEINGGWAHGVHPEDREACIRTYHQAFDARKPFEMEYRLLRHDGSYRNMLDRGQPSYDMHGKFLGYVGSCFDITDRKDLQAEGKRILALLDETSNMAQVGGWEYNLVARKNTWTKEVYHIHEVDYDYQPNIRESINFYHHDDRLTLVRCYNELIHSGKEFNLELRLITAKSNTKWIHMQGKAVYEDGKISKLIGAFQDITAQKESDLMIKESERKMRFVLNGLPVAVYLTDSSGVITDYNDSAVELWGRKPQLGKDKWCGSYKLYSKSGEFMPHDECPMAISVKSDKEVHGEEAILERENGTRLNFIAFATPYKNEQGEIQGAMNVMVDITDRKLIEEKLTSLSFVAKKTSNSVVITDAQRRITWVNSGFTKITGYSYEEAVGKKPGELLHFEETSQTTLNDVRTALDKGMPVRVEILNRAKNGNKFWLDMDIQPLLDSKGTIAGYISVESDITELKFMHDALLRSEHKLRAILDSTSEDNILVDRNYKVLSYNKMAQQNTKLLYGRDIMVGEYVWEYVMPEMKAEFEQDFQQAVSGSVVKKEKEFSFGAGLSQWFELCFYPVYANDGNLIGVALNSKNIDDKKRSDLKVKEQNERLKQIAFTQSHTLRRPVANILGLWHLIKHELDVNNASVSQLHELLTYLGRSVEETDLVIKKISSSTSESSEF